MSVETTISETAVYPSRWRLGLLALGALGFVLVSIWVWKTIFLPEVLIAVVFFGACFLYAAYRCIYLQASLVFDGMGFRDNASALASGFVQWHEVKRVTVRVFTSQRFLCVYPVDPESILMRQHPLKRKFMRMNIGLLGTPITIPLNVLRESEKDLLDLFRQYSGGRFPVDSPVD